MSSYDDLPLVSDREAPPLWFRYAVYIEGGHDKFYEVSIDLTESGNFAMTRRWGRRPDRLESPAGQTKIETYASMYEAQTHAMDLFVSKLSKGYREVERGW